MITLKEAFKLCRVDDGEVIHLCDNVEYAPLWSLPITGAEIRKKYDMRRTMVTAIIPHYYFGEFDGFTFVISRKANGE